ncbi:MAG: tetratricopeptide repeat protein, partial [Desulfurobacteriaceae bacterium]
MRKAIYLLATLPVLFSCVTSTTQKDKIALKPSQEVKKAQNFLYYYMVYLQEKNKGNLTKAYENLIKAVELSNYKEEFLLEAAKFSASLKKLDDAERFARKVLKVDPKNSQALKILGEISILKGNRKEAKKFLKEALEFSKDKDVYLMLSNLYI